MRTSTLRRVFVAVAVSMAASVPAMANEPETPAVPVTVTNQNTSAASPETVYNLASTKAVVTAAKKDTDLIDDPVKRAAAEEAVASEIRKLISQGANASYDNGEAYCIAVLKGNLPAVKVLIEEGHVDPNIRRGDAITLGALRGRDSVLNYLIDKGMDPDGIHKNGRPLASAAGNNHVSSIELLKRRGADININGGYALAIAAKLGADSMTGIKALLANGANINVGSGMPLFAAYDGGNEDVFNFLIEQGGDINIDNGGPLRTAVYAKNKKAIDFLLAHGANINAGRGMVMRAALENGDSEMAQFLIDKGADPTLAGVGEGLEYIRQNPAKYEDAPHREVIALLNTKREGKVLQPITDVANLPEADVVTDYKAKMAGAPEAHMIKVSAKQGMAKYEGQLQYDETDGFNLATAALENNLETMTAIIAKKTADPNFNDGLPLQNAAMGGSIEALKLLLDAGADINASDGIAFLMAADAGKLNVVNFLIERKMDLFGTCVELFLEQMQLVKSAETYAKTKYSQPVYDDIVNVINKARTEFRPDYVPKVYQAVPVDGNPNMFKSAVPRP